MCGIAGWITQKPKFNSGSLLKQMADVIEHRGPDDEGFYTERFSSNGSEVALAHRRLSIIDIGGGHQPMIDASTGNVVVFNGEIYNFQTLRQELKALGAQFTSNSDTEVILHAYRIWGKDCIRRFRGMFAFALWDKKDLSLLLARDHFGKKPVFIYQNSNSLVFASEIKAILEHPEIAREVDEPALWDYFSYRYVPAPATLFKGIRKLMPGSFAIWKNGKFKETRYFWPPDKFALKSPNQPDDPVNDFISVLDEAVKLRMISDVPFGAFLSGGVDSSAIVALMARHSSLPIRTFSVGFKEAKYSELPHCRVIAKQFATEHHELIVSENELMDHLPDLIRFRDAPVAEPSDIPIYLLAKEARRSVKMVLTGEGSDEFLGGYPKHVYERYARLSQYIPSIIRNNVISLLLNMLPYGYSRAATALTTLNMANSKERLPRWFGAMSWQKRRRLLNDIIGKSKHGVQFATDNDNSYLRKILYFDQTSWLPDNLLERGDRMTMAASLEARMPFMDIEVAKFISGLPDNYRVQNKTTKWILRQAMKQLLPESIINRPKVGFKVPVNEWFKGSMRDYLYDHLTSANSLTSHYYHKNELHRYLHEHVSGKRNHEKLLWALLNLELWFTINMKGS